MPKIAWARNIYNAYNCIKNGEKVYSKQGELLGISDGTYARATYKSPGSVCLVKIGKFIWISGNVERKNNEWYLTD